MPTGDFLSGYFSYDPDTGVIKWKSRPEKGAIWNAKYPGREAGCITENGYKQIRLNGRGYRYHRVAWALFFGTVPDDMLIDHRNGNKLDNRIENLRTATLAQNSRNKKKNSNFLASELKGVGFDHARQKYRALIRVDGRRVNLGRSDTAEGAHALYRKAAAKYFGSFARFE